MTADTTYNGWANWATWNAHLWLTNDEGSYELAREAAAYDGPHADSAWQDFVSCYVYGSLGLDVEGRPAPNGIGADFIESVLGDIDYVALRAALMPECDDCGEPLTADGSGDGSGDPHHVFCDICDGVEHPAALTSDWNGETGCHRSCED